MRLFLDRARGVRPGFALTAENAPDVAAISRRLDGLPLAIELAAARVRHLPPAALLVRLEFPAGGLPLLTGGARDAPARQRTLRDTLAWSHDLLAPAEQALFRRLGVFAGGFTLEAAEAVGAAGAASAAPDVLAGLASLVDMSLVEPVAAGPAGAARAGEARYRMLGTIREDASERLAAAGKTAAVAARHTAYYTRLAERAAPSRGVDLPAPAPWLDALEADHDNLRAALAWLEAAGDAAALLRLATAVAPFWQVHGHFAEASRWLEAALAGAEQAPDALRATALLRAGSVAYVRGDDAGARGRYEASLELFRRLGAESEAAAVLLSLGWLERREGDGGRARALLEDGLARFRAAGDVLGVARALNSLGWVAQWQGELARAEALLEECLTIARRAGAAGIVGPALQNLGKVALARGDAPRAAALFGASLRTKQELGNRYQVANLLVWIAQLAERTGQPERAARLLGAQQALREALHAPHPPDLPPEHVPVAAAVRARLGDARFAAGWAAGRALSAEEAVALARGTSRRHRRRTRGGARDRGATGRTPTDGPGGVPGGATAGGGRARRGIWSASSRERPTSGRSTGPPAPEACPYRTSALRRGRPSRQAGPPAPAERPALPGPRDDGLRSHEAQVTAPLAPRQECREPSQGVGRDALRRHDVPGRGHAVSGRTILAQACQ